MNDFQKSAMLSAASKAAYTGIKVDAKIGTSFGGFRKYAQNLRKAILIKKDELDKSVDELKTAYSSSVYDPVVKDLTGKFNEEVASLRESLTVVFDRICNEKRDAVKRFTMVPPSDDVLKLVNAFSFRDKADISDTEWSYLVSVAGDNYQALRMVQKLANDCERPFSLPFTPDDTLKKIDKLVEIIDASIRSIAVPDNEVANSLVTRFYNYDGEEGRIYDPFIGDLIKELDSNAGSVVPEEYKSIIQKLKDAQQKAFDNDNIYTSARIKNFIEKYDRELHTPEEMKDFIFEKAQELIKQANETPTK